jgi:hypothetical protein
LPVAFVAGRARGFCTNFISYVGKCVRDSVNA